MNPSRNEVEELRRRLHEAEETLLAIRCGEVDAVIVDGPAGPNVFTLRGADHTYRLLIEAMEQGAATLSADGTVLSCNRSFARMLGVAHEKAIGSRFAVFVAPERREAFERMLERSRTGRGQGESLLRSALDGDKPVYLSLSPLGVEVDGLAIGLIVTDLTEQKKHLDLQDANRRKDEFLAMLAHELRNPLAPILNSVTILGHLAKGNEKLASVGRIIERQTMHMARLVDDLLDVSRISLGKVELRKIRVDLAEVIGGAVETSRPLIDARRHALTLELPAERIYLEADATRIAQVFSNLLTNAARYCDESGSIRVSVAREGGVAVVRVRDTGVGISADLLPFVFDLFTQGDRSLARSEGGLGIGLTLVRRLAELHGGSVEARSDGPGRGSEFIVRLPALPPAEPSRGPTTSAPAEVPAGLEILVVDDNKDGADSMAQMMEILGHRVTVAYNGQDALAVAETIRPGVVMLDIGLPGLDGYEVARRLRTMPVYESAILVAITGYGQEDDRRLSTEAGFDWHFVKPVDVGELLRVLESISVRTGRPFGEVGR